MVQITVQVDPKANGCGNREMDGKVRTYIHTYISS